MDISLLNLGSTEKAAWSAAEDVVRRAGFRIWDVIFEKEGAMYYLRVLFYGESDTDIDTCEAVTREINPLFDKEKWIEHVDILEVGSRGLSARLRHNFHFKEAAESRAPVKYSVRDASGGKLTAYTRVAEDFDEETGTLTVNRGETAPEKLSVSSLVKINLNY